MVPTVHVSFTISPVLGNSLKAWSAFVVVAIGCSSVILALKREIHKGYTHEDSTIYYGMKHRYLVERIVRLKSFTVK